MIQDKSVLARLANEGERGVPARGTHDEANTGLRVGSEALSPAIVVSHPYEKKKVAGMGHGALGTAITKPL
jgi:hypothetical protein